VQKLLVFPILDHNAYHNKEEGQYPEIILLTHSLIHYRKKLFPWLADVLLDIAGRIKKAEALSLPL
jgi:hypothetical protein